MHTHKSHIFDIHLVLIFFLNLAFFYVNLVNLLSFDILKNNCNKKQAVLFAVYLQAAAESSAGAFSVFLLSQISPAASAVFNTTASCDSSYIPGCLCVLLISASLTALLQLPLMPALYHIIQIKHFPIFKGVLTSSLRVGRSNPETIWLGNCAGSVSSTKNAILP